MDRPKGIGGTDISAIVGMNPWKSPLDVWLEKTGQSTPDEDSEAKWWGREMEPILKKRYEQETGLNVYVPSPEVLPWHSCMPNLGWYVGSPDGLIMATNPGFAWDATAKMSEGGVDFKTSGKPDEWGEPGTDQIPNHYILQGQWYLGLTGAQWWDFAVLIMSFTRKFAIYRVHRDQELIDSLVDAGATFWQDNVLSNVAPPIDGSKSSSDYLKRKFPSDSGPLLEPTDAEILADVDRYREGREQVKHWESVVALYENRLKDFIGDCQGIKGDFGKITWKCNKNGERLDYKAMAAAHPEIAKQFMKSYPGARVFRPYFAKEI